MSVFMPSLFPLTPNLVNNREERETRHQEIKVGTMSVLEYLGSVKGVSVPEPTSPRMYNPKAGESPCFDLFCRFHPFNWGRLIIDTFCGCTKLATKPPAKNTYMTESAYNKLITADIYVNRNSAILCCGTPPLLILLGFAGVLTLPAAVLTPLSGGAAATSSIIALSCAGCLTYFFSGDFGGKERLAFDELLEVYDHLAKFLKETWNNPDEKEKLQIICELIRRNSVNISIGLRNSGLDPIHVDQITKKFFTQIEIIIKDSIYENFDRVNLEFRLLPMDEQPEHIVIGL